MSQFRTIALASLFGLAGGLVGASIAPMLPFGHAGQVKAVREALLERPEILSEAAEKLKSGEAEKQLAQVAPQALKAWPGAVIGNPQGKHVLVEFMDYACGYCRASEEDVAKLVAADPQAQVVIRQLPILTPESVDAAKMALAAAKQGKYAAFHKAMFAAGRPNAQTIAASAQTAALDMAAAQKVIADPATQAEIEANLALARHLGLGGTPSWIAGGKILGGAVGYDALAAAIKG
ncbi:DsbA family protein [Novosphingobium sediminicola]|uniref:Protein-disulfide isomerase n=1 Tax=Novosphingobium sediminicola TaxID=563162 RepID=A0A7W6CLD6_9SPHN|nr:DsbA family protein [Novosphingobium sediminicola]MBB3956764.1 protein-disulfide isomerase [Novosphingobium sediminicola]